MVIMRQSLLISLMVSCGSFYFSESQEAAVILDGGAGAATLVVVDDTDSNDADSNELQSTPQQQQQQQQQQQAEQADVVLKDHLPTVAVHDDSDTSSSTGDDRSSTAVTVNIDNDTITNYNSTNANRNKVNETRKKKKRRRKLPNSHLLRPPQSSASLLNNNKKEFNAVNTSSIHNLDAVSLSDRWNLILHQELSNEQHRSSKNTQFVNLLKEQHEHDETLKPTISPQYTSSSSSSKTNSNTNTNTTAAPDEHPLYAYSWSILLTAGTLLAMTSATTLQTLLFSASSQPQTFQTILQTLKSLPTTIFTNTDITTLLSAEYEMTQKVTQYVTKIVLPIGKETFQKMAWMEIWRSVWKYSFRLGRKTYHLWTGNKYYDSVWEKYAPGWLRRGVRSVVVKKLQGGLQGLVYGWITRGWEVVSIGFGSGWLDFEIVGDGDGDNVDDNGIGDASDNGSDGGDGYIGGGGESEECDQGGLDEMDMELDMEFENGADCGEAEGGGMDEFIMNDDVDMDLDFGMDIEQ